MINRIIFCMLALTTNASASDWFCEDESSQRQGNVITVCGIGVDKNEAEARSIALDNAKAEFESLCNSSDDCKDHPVRIDPKRTSCKRERGRGGMLTCYRLVNYIVAGDKREEPKPEPRPEPEAEPRQRMHFDREAFMRGVDQVNRAIARQPTAPTKTLDYNCQSNCTMAGNSYGLCESRCSY